MLMAFSTSPAASTSAARQSLKPAPVRSRNSFTRCAGICIADCCVLILFFSLACANLLIALCTGVRCAYLQSGPAPRSDLSAGPFEIYASAVCLPGFLVRRDGCLRRFRRFRRHFAFDKIAFLLLVLF